MKLNVPIFSRIKWMVYEMGTPFRGFETKREAQKFASTDSSMEVIYIPPKYKTIEVEEAPF